MPVSHNLENPYLIGESEELFLSKYCASPARGTYNVGWTGSSDGSSLDVVEITASPFQKSEESPVSKRSINATEIYRNPGGNRDISKVITSLPGVASTVSFRNDIIINEY